MYQLLCIASKAAIIIAGYVAIYSYSVCVCNCSIVDGGWGGWIPGRCSKTCGGGIRSLTRKCNNPKPYCNGKHCEGESYYKFPGKCNDFCCPGKNLNIVAFIIM